MNQALKGVFSQITTYNDFENPSLSNHVLNGNLKNILQPSGLQLTRFIQNHQDSLDYILCQGGNSSIPYYKGNVPIAYWHDSSWNSIWRDYRDNSNYLGRRRFKEFKNNFKNLYLWDKYAMDRADLIVFSSNYVAEACIDNYSISCSKVKVIPFGANIVKFPTTAELSQSMQKRCRSGSINLTFIGKDWRRKGLAKAYQLVCKLNSIGVPAKLTIIGCYPQSTIELNPDYVNLVGYIDKSKQDDLNTFNEVLRDTHFLIHPASSEPFGIALCEANAFGIPVIGTNVDGLNTIIKPGANGFRYKQNKFIRNAAIQIKDIASDLPGKYPSIYLSTLEQFNSRLNWQVNAENLKSALKTSLQH